MNASEPLDDAFARFITRFGGGEPVAMAARTLSRAVREGHLCLSLARPPADEPEWPSLAEWREALAACRAVGPPSAAPQTPLVLDAEGRLYLARYYRYEQQLAEALRSRCGATGPGGGEGQEAAVETAVTRPLTLISGGPGTGKTTTVLKILERLLAMGPLGRVRLAAPTGKAAARLDEAVRSGVKERGGALAATVEAIPRATTLDRLLGTRPGTTALRYHAENPLPIDLLVVDEASMVALPLMAKLFEALPSAARVILLGDRDQLASVAPGSVLADLADAAGSPQSPLHGALVMLRTNYRFGNESAIYRACEAIRSGDAATALAVAREGHPELCGMPLPEGEWDAAFREAVLAGYGPYRETADPARALEVFARFRILAAVRRGPHGVDELNRQTQVILREAGRLGSHGEGMPLLIRQNDYRLGLFNGDIGLLLPDPAEEDGRLWAWFPGVNPHDPPRRFAPARLPEHQPAFVMTVHQSQGSEFARILLVLPGKESPVVTRELIYTGLTRARERVDLWYAPEPFATGVAHRAERESGLRDALRQTRP